MTVFQTNRTRFSRLLFGSLLIFVASLTSHAQQPRIVESPATPLRVVDFSGDLRAFLAFLAQSYDITLGFEADPAQPNSSLTFNVRDATIDDVFNALVKAKPSFAWRRESSQFDFYPKDRATPFLETIVNSFEVTGVSRTVALNQLFKLAEVQTAMSAFRFEFIPLDELPDERKLISLNVDGLTIRQALHSIAAAGGARFWAFYRSSGPRRVFLTVEMH